MRSRLRLRRSATAAALAAAVVFACSPNIPQAAAQAEGRPAIGSQADAQLIATLIRATLIALHQANSTGNYTVLRDLGAPSFRELNTPADLAANFAALRERQIDLNAVAVLQPQSVDMPIIDPNNLLRVSGTFPTEPSAIYFDLAFQVVDRVWRLVGIRVGVAEQTDNAEGANVPIPTPRPDAAAGEPTESAPAE